MPRRLLSAAAACTLLLGLSSCGEGGDGPVTTPPPEIDISAPSDGGGDGSASDGGGDEGDPSAAPDLPAPDPADYPGMDENTSEGGVQAFRFYIASVYRAHSTGDADQLSDLYRESCESCVELEDEVEALNRDDKLWPRTAIFEAWCEPRDSQNFDVEVSYGFRLSTNGSSGTASNGRGVEGVAMTAIAGMVWEDGRWVVDGMQIGESEHG